MTDYRSLATAERYAQPFSVYAYGLLKEFDLPQVASAVAPRPVMFLNPVTPTGEPSGREVQELYAAVANVSIQAVDAKIDPVQFVSRWMAG
jgi:hypothetical protein